MKLNNQLNYWPGHQQHPEQDQRMSVICRMKGLLLQLQHLLYQTRFLFILFQRFSFKSRPNSVISTIASTIIGLTSPDSPQEAHQVHLGCACFGRSLIPAINTFYCDIFCFLFIQPFSESGDPICGFSFLRII